MIIYGSRQSQIIHQEKIICFDLLVESSLIPDKISPHTTNKISEVSPDLLTKSISLTATTRVILGHVGYGVTTPNHKLCLHAST